MGHIMAFIYGFANIFSVCYLMLVFNNLLVPDKCFKINVTICICFYHFIDVYLQLEDKCFSSDSLSIYSRCEKA